MFKSLMHPSIRPAWGGEESELLRVHREVWREKPLLRRIYREWWTLVVRHLVLGRTLEVGAGIGEFRRFFRGELVSTDILPGARADLLCDAHRLPFAADSFANVVCVDLVHHLARPLVFMQEVERVLRPGGRFVAVEPFLSPFSALIHKAFHHEASERAWSPVDGDKLEAWSADLRVPTDLFHAHPDHLPKACHSLRVLEVRPHTSSLVYPLSGGFTYRSLIPESVAPLLDTLDRLLGPARRLLAFKLLIVVEKTAAPSGA